MKPKEWICPECLGKNGCMCALKPKAEKCLCKSVEFNLGSYIEANGDCPVHYPKSHPPLQGTVDLDLEEVAVKVNKHPETRWHLEDKMWASKREILKAALPILKELDEAYAAKCIGKTIFMVESLLHDK